VRHHAKFCASGSGRCGDVAVFDFFKITAVRHVGFLEVGNFNYWYRLVGTCPRGRVVSSLGHQVQ